MGNGCSLETPFRLHGSHAATDHSYANDNPCHPDSRTESRHDEIGREVKDDIADVEKGETCRHLMIIDVEDFA